MIMNIRFEPTVITRLKAIDMIEILINQVYVNEYDNVSELDFLKDTSFIFKIMRVVNEFTIQILDLHQAYQEIDINIFRHVQEDHRNQVENGYIRNDNLDFDFILTRNSLISNDDYINLLINQLYDIGLPHLEYDELGYKIISSFVECKEYNSTTSNDPVVRYDSDAKAIEILHYKYNIIKKVMDIDYTKDAGVDYYPDFANIEINCTF